MRSLHIDIRSTVALLAASGCLPAGDPKPDPAPVVELPAAVQIDAGGSHTCAVLENGNGACWGSDNWGQLGDTPKLDANGQRLSESRVPRWIALDADPLALAGGDVHGCAIVAGGQVRCWGQSGGFLGVSDEGCVTDQRCIVPPRPVPGLQDVVAIAASAAGDPLDPPLGSTCAITSDARVLCWGDNRSGKLGVGASDELVLAPRQVFDERGFPLRDISRVTLGGSHGCALADSAVYCWGSVDYGEGAGGIYARRIDTIGPAIDVAAGRHHTCVVTNTREVMCWGLNNNRQAGDFTGDRCGYDDCVTTPQKIAGVSAAIAVAAGALHTCALTAGGAVYCWGSNERGQLGNPELALSLPAHRVSLGTATAITAGEAHTCALLDDGAVWCWGDDHLGQLGRGADS